MVKIRLARYGKKHRPFYRIVAIQARSKRNGEPIEFLGHYDPFDKVENAKFDKERVEYWLSVGAQPTERVHRLLAKHGVLEALPANYKSAPGTKSQERAEAKKQKEEEAKATAAEAKSEVKEEAKAE